MRQAVTERSRKVELMKLAKVLAWGMFAVVTMTTAIAFIGGEEAHAATAHKSAACADVIASPTDGRCKLYERYSRQFAEWDNDHYARVYYHAETKGESGLRRRAAHHACTLEHSLLAEDFSCVPRSFYD
jgi:hypothetical protein